METVFASPTTSTTTLSAETRPQTFDKNHEMETQIRRDLLAQGDWEFQSLVVRRVRDGIALEGVLCTDLDPEDVSTRIRQFAGVVEVLNHLVICQDGSK